jgi:heparan-alpha-glucosaminide N-acetyltransferase
MSTSKQPVSRVLSIDIMRGLTLFLMLFVNDLFEPGVPTWLLHAKADVDGMGLADWVFPGFLFMVGVSIPFAIHSRIQKGHLKAQIFGHIILRTLSLLLIGVFMLNTDRLNGELSGINGNLWAILVYVSIFLIWNKYPSNHRWHRLFLALKITGIAGLVVLAILFRAGEPGHVSWFETSWWGILGLIGWGYLVAASASLFLGDRLWTAIVLWLSFVVLNMLSQLGLLECLHLLNPVFGVIIDGNVPSIVLAGFVVSLILKHYSQNPAKAAGTIMLMGLFCLAAGFILRHWFIISKIQGTPSWAMICNGISMFIFSLLFLLIDIKGKSKWSAIFKPVGQNSLTTYLAPDVIYFICWGLSLPFFFYKQTNNPLLAVGGSLGWALAMVGFSALLSRINIRLKL